LVIAAAFPAEAETGRLAVTATPSGAAEIIQPDGAKRIVPKERGQTGIDQPKAASDNRSAGWLVLYDNPDGGEPLPGMLVIWRSGRIVRRFRTEQVFWSWAFVESGKLVAYHTGPTHGAAPHCELRNVDSGSVVATWDGDLDDPEQRSKAPEWIRGLEH
jgi:hypothetical protein